MCVCALLSWLEVLLFITVFCITLVNHLDSFPLKLRSASPTLLPLDSVLISTDSSTSEIHQKQVKSLNPNNLVETPWTLELDSLYFVYRGFLGGLDGKESVCSAGDLASVPGLGRSPGEGNDNLLHGQRNLAGYSPWVARVRHDLATKSPRQ